MQCDCAGRRSLAAVIDQPPEVKRILAHVGLGTEALTKPGESIWRVTGLPEEMSPSELGDAGLRVGVDGADEELGVPLFDELPAEEWAA